MIKQRAGGNLEEFKSKFFSYLKKCNDDYRSGNELKLYRQIISLHRKYGDLEKILANEANFCDLIFRTLVAFNMNQHAARLTPVGKLRESIIGNKDRLLRVCNFKMENLTSEDYRQQVKELLKDLFLNLKVMDTRSRIVGGSKALHFLLPDLVPPMDRKYTMGFFYGHNNYKKDGEREFEVFNEIMEEFIKIVQELRLDSSRINSDNTSWNTSVPKLIDNAIIGFTKSKEDHNLFKERVSESE